MRNAVLLFVIWVLSAMVFSPHLLAQNLAPAGTATASSGNAAAAIDNNTGTRWESAFSDPQWIQIELTQVYSLTGFKIVWEAANAKNYIIEVSANGTDWSTVTTQTDMPNSARTDEISVSVDAKYVKLTGTERNLTYGYSIWEFEIHGVPVGHVSTLTSIELSAPSNRTPVNTPITITATGYDQDNYVMAITPAWSTTGGTVTDGVFESANKGDYTITATQAGISGNIAITVGDPEFTGITAVASSGSASAALAFDGNSTTRWESDASDPQWLYADFGTLVTLTDIKIVWEAANAKDYTLDISADGVNWQTISTFVDGTFGARTDHFELTATARYLRMNGSARSSAWGYSIYEFDIYGTSPATTALTALNIAAPYTTIAAGQSLQLAVSGTDANGNAYAVVPVWSVAEANGNVDANNVFTASVEGTYHVTVTDGSVSKTITITVQAPQQLTTIEVAPDAQLVGVGNTLTFSASGYDQYGQVMPTPVTWSVSGGGTIDVDGIFTASDLGQFTVTATNGTINGTAQVTVVPANLALTAVVTASSAVQAANLATDDNLLTRWESVVADSQWIQLDFGTTRYLSEFYLIWEAAAAKDYELQISADNLNWQVIKVQSQMAAAPRTDTILVNASAQHLRMFGLARNTPYGYSLYEFKALGVNLPDGKQLTNIKVMAADSAIMLGDSLQCFAHGFDAQSEAFATSPVWSVNNTTNATVSATGLFKCTTKGTYTVTATQGAISNTFQINVYERELDSIAITPLTTEVEAGKTVQFNAVAFDQFGDTILVDFTYTSNGGGTIDQSGLYSALSVGNHSVTVSSGNLSATAAVTVTYANLATGSTAMSSNGVTNAALAFDGDAATYCELAAADSQYIVINLGQRYSIGQVVLNWSGLTTGTYQLAISADTVNWHTIFDASSASSAKANVEFKASAQLIRLLVMQNEGAIQLNELQVLGQPLPPTASLDSIEIKAAKIILKPNQPVALEAQGFDAGGVPFAMVPIWSVVEQGAIVSSAGVFVASVSGQYTVVATSGSVTDHLIIEVEALPRLAEIVVSPADTTLIKGASVAFAANGFDQFGEVFEAEFSWSVNGGGNITPQGLFTATELGTYFVTAVSEQVSGTTSITIETNNIAIDREAVASSQTNDAALCNDADMDTYWESEGNNNEWLYLNLGQSHQVNNLAFIWGANAPEAYKVAISADAQNWQTVRSVTRTSGTTDTLMVNLSGKYLRMLASQVNAATVQLAEFEVVGKLVPSNLVLTSLKVVSPVANTTAGTIIQLEAQGFDQNAHPMAAAPQWTVSSGGFMTDDGKFTATTGGVYTITAKVGQLSASTTITVGTTEIENPESMGVKVYCQNRSIVVKYPQAFAGEQVKIYNTLGVLVKVAVLNNGEAVIPMDNASNGIYIVTIDANLFGSKKVMVY